MGAWLAAFSRSRLLCGMGLCWLAFSGVSCSADGKPDVFIPATAEQLAKEHPGPRAIEWCRSDGSPQVGRTPLRRISRAEYNHAVRDLFGDASLPGNGAGFPDDERVHGFISNGQTLLTAVNNEGYLDAAEGVASRAATGFEELSGCEEVADPECSLAFLQSLARRAFHGTLPAEASARIEAQYSRFVSLMPEREAVALVLQAILLSPRFLFVIEEGLPEATDAEASLLTPSEVAGRLAAFLWRSVPDAALLAAADSGKLDDAAGIMTHAASMLQDERARPMLDEFVIHWLGLHELDRFVRVDPVFSRELRESMQAETTATFAHAIGAGWGFRDLFTSGTSYLMPGLARLYGVPHPTGDGLAAVQLPKERHGILLKAGFLATHAHPSHPSPVLRGKVVREQLLCDPVPDPPPGVAEVPAVTEPRQAAEAFDAHATPGCVGCHQWMDPIGKAFAAYDELGRHVSSALEAEGEIVPGLESPVAAHISGPLELQDVLATEAWPQQCFTTQVLRFGLGRSEYGSDACSMASLWQRFRRPGASVQELFVQITGTTAFRYRRSFEPGGACQ